MLGQRTPLNFEARLKIGKEFEESVSTFLTSQGWPIKLYFSATGQWEWGESAAHVEIKFDRRLEETGNAFIETRERRDDTGLSQWRAAGIYDASEPWFYLIGNDYDIWLLSVRWLDLMKRSNKYQERTTATSEGFLIPRTLLDKTAIKHWNKWKRADEHLA